MTSFCRVASRLGSVLILVAGLIAAGAGVAFGHVSVDAGGARQGASEAVLTFRVPNERANATTVEVAIKFPTLTPLGSIKPASVPGWTFETRRVRLDIPVNTADGEITETLGEVVYRVVPPSRGIPVGGFESFEVLVGPLPTGIDTLAFPTVQKYSNGDVSSWIQPTIAGSEPSNPAPTLVLPPADAALTGSSGGGAAASGAGGESGVASRDEVRTAQIMGIIGVVTGSLGLLTAGVALGRRRRSAPDL